MKKFLLVFCIAIVVATPLRSFAAEMKFFEFGTDVGTPIEIPNGSNATQEFKIYNDQVSAIDLWFDNTGSAGSATISLLSDTNALLASRTVTVGHSDPFYTGQRLHVNFNRTINVQPGSSYTIKIVSATGAMRLYGVNRFQFVEHNAQVPLDIAIGASTVNNETRFTAFKFALYEEKDTEPPIITNVTASLYGSDAVKIAFNANELVDYSLVYGVVGSGATSSIGFNGNYSICFAGVRDCSILVDTQRGVDYVYRLIARDSWGNTSFVDGAFASWRPQTTPPGEQPPAAPQQPQPQTTPPGEQPPAVPPLTISNARVASVTDRSVLVSWDTNRAANGTLIISTDPLGGSIVTQTTDATLELVHTLSVAGLSANRSYYATIVSRDASALMGAQVLRFSTAQKTSEPQPTVPTQPSGQLQSVVFQEQGTVSLTWNVPAAGEPSGGYRVDVIDAQGNLFRTQQVSAGVHSVEVSGLRDGEYRAIAYAETAGVEERIADPAPISMRKAPPPIDTYELIKKPIVYIPSILFVMLVGGLYWYSKRQKQKNIKQ